MIESMKRRKMKALRIFPVFLLAVIAIVLFPIEALAGWKLEVPIPKLGSGEVDLKTYVEGIYTFAAGAVGIVGVLMFMVGGFQYMLSVGNKGMSNEAKKTMWNAIIGIVMVISAYVFLKTINPELIELQSLNFSN